MTFPSPIFRIGLIVALMIVCATPSPAPLIYRPGEGWEVQGEDTVEGTSKQQHEKGEKYERENKFDEAANAYRLIPKTWPLSPNAPEGQYRFGVMMYKLFDFQRSFKEFQKCLEKYPETEHFDEILKYQYDIACLFLAGERQKIWRIPTFPSMDKTVEMFQQVIKNGPYSDVAPMSQLMIGFAREKQHQWTDAVKAYQEVVRRYPKSDLADDAQFQIGYAYMMASREADYDQTATNRAITGFRDYITKYPKSEKIEQARDNISRLQMEQARGIWSIAEFYDREKNSDAALIYYNSLIQKFPNSDLAKRAYKRVEAIKKRRFESELQESKSESKADSKGDSKPESMPAQAVPNLPPAEVDPDVTPSEAIR